MMGARGATHDNSHASNVPFPTIDISHNFRLRAALLLKYLDIYCTWRPQKSESEALYSVHITLHGIPAKVAPSGERQSKLLGRTTPSLTSRPAPIGTY
jgi:hypothetical protein